jgi:hypothetical protein
MKNSHEFIKVILICSSLMFSGGCTPHGELAGGQTTAGAMMGAIGGTVLGVATGQNTQTTLIMAGAGAALGGFAGEYVKRLSQRDQKRRKMAQAAMLKNSQQNMIDMTLPDANVHMHMQSSPSFYVPIQQQYAPQGYASGGAYHMTLPKYEWKQIIERYTPSTYSRGHKGSSEKPITITQWAYRESPKHEWKITESPEKIVIETYKRLQQQGIAEQQYQQYAHPHPSQTYAHYPQPPQYPHHQNPRGATPVSYYQPAPPHMSY